MRSVFLGKPLHWLILVVILGVLWWMGDGRLQTRDFSLFIFILLGLAVGAVVIMRLSYRQGDQVTRDPFEDDGEPRA